MNTDAWNVGGFQRYLSAGVVARVSSVQHVAATGWTSFSLPRIL